MAEFNFSRIQVWMDALNMSLDSLLLGTGQGHFSLVFPAYHQEMKPISHAHNQFVQILCENGVAGLLCFLVILFLLFRLIRRRSMKTSGDDLSFALRSGAAGALVAAGIYSCFETPLEWPASASFLLVPVAILLLPLPGEEETDGAVRVRWPWFALASIAILAWIFPAAGMVQAVPSGVLGDRGHALFKEGRFSEAAEALRASAEAWPCRPEIREMEAMAHYRNQETEKALKAAQASLELRPGTLTMLSMCGRCLKQLRRYKEAGEYFKKAMHSSRFEKTHQALFELGKTYRLSGSPEAALSVFEHLHFKKPKSMSSAALNLEMAAALIQLKRDSELAASLLRKASTELLGRKNLSELRKVPWLIKSLEMNFELTPHEMQRLERLKERVEEILDTLDDS
jgi:tetratricopeptide (TPR) repeat protein